MIVARARAGAHAGADVPLTHSATRVLLDDVGTQKAQQ